MLDDADAGNLTPRGKEGVGVSASPGCEQAMTLFANLAGVDGKTNTLDDDFTLALLSPAIDRGIDSRGLGLPIAASILETDHNREGARPADGDGDGVPAFDIGALESKGLQCRPGTTETCYDGLSDTVGVGLCHAGARTCTPEGMLGLCEGQVLPQPDVCNGLDDDCDGQPDEELGQTICGVGACQRTVDNCTDGQPRECTPGAPSPEICGNGIDEDCDGQDLTCPINQPPTITSPAVTAATIGQLYSYDVDAIDPNVGDTLTYSLDTGPEGMVIDSTTGAISWTPTISQMANQNVTVRVQDQDGLSDT